MTPERWQEVKSLLAPAMELEAAARAAFLDQLCGNDATLRDDVNRVLAAAGQAGPDFLTRPVELPADSATEAVTNFAALFLPWAERHADEGWIGRRVGHYEILELISAGGMGEVYRATRADDEYRKQVAIKLLRLGHDSLQFLNRFKVERQILASLDHPNIARLLDGGTIDGQPYFVMELIQGDPLDQYSKKRRLPVREKLALFTKICSAVQFAHQHLVIHRDLKPGNILVTDEGDPKLLDFGIAKILAPAAAQDQPCTVTVFQALTPRYASPEQIRGEPITTATDVYSLGVILYELLTGCSPYPAVTSAQELTRAIQELDPEKPSVRCTMPAALLGGQGAGETVVRAEGNVEKLSKALQGDLDNIILMALRKEPARRYSSVEQFADDIRRYLEDVPVRARRDTFNYRASKFVRRYKTGVLAGAAVTAALMLAMAITVREARMAQRRFNDVQMLANSLIFDVHDSIKDLPGSTAARKLIIEKALTYLDSLARDAKRDPALQRELSAAYKRIGDVQGEQYAANLGDTPGALKSYEKALAIRQAVYSAHQDNVDDAVAVAESLQDMSYTLLASGETNAALKNIQQAVAISEATQQRHPQEIKVLQELTQNYEAEADIFGGTFNLSNLGNASAALSYRQKELSLRERLVAMQPHDVSVQRTMAVTIGKMGDQLLLDGKWREALDYYRRAQQSFEVLAAQSPTEKVLENLHALYTRVQQVEAWSGNFQQAVLTNRKALELSRKISLADASNTFGVLLLAGDYGNLADALSREGVKEEAMSAIRQASAKMGELVARNPKNTEYAGLQAAVYVTAGDVCRRFRDYAGALRNYQEALSISSQIQSADPNNADVRFRLAEIETELGRTLVKLGRVSDAAEAYNNALALATSKSQSPGSEEELYVTANAYAGLGQVEETFARAVHQHGANPDHWKRACSSYAHSRDIWKQVREPGELSPQGFEPIMPSLVSAELANCLAVASNNSDQGGTLKRANGVRKTQ